MRRGRRRRCFATLQPVEREVRGARRRWYLVRVLPYRTSEDRIDGAVLNFIDVTERRRGGGAAARARRAPAPGGRQHEGLRRHHPRSAGPRHQLEQGRRADVRLHRGRDAGRALPACSSCPRTAPPGCRRQELRKAREDGRAQDERWHLRKDGSRFYCSGITTPLVERCVKGYAKIARDLTERQLLERQREELLERREAGARRSSRPRTPCAGRIPGRDVARAQEPAEPDPAQCRADRPLAGGAEPPR